MKLGKKDTGNDGTEVPDEKRKVLDPFKDVDPMPTPMAGPDGGPVMQGYLGPAEPIPAATPENFICLAGPCRYYIEIHSYAEVETRGLSHTPRQINRLCRVMSGVELDLTDDCVFACSEWDPQDPKELAARDARRKTYKIGRKKGSVA